MKQINADTNTFANHIVKIAESVDFATYDIDDFAKTVDSCDKSVIKAAKSLQSGRMNLDDFRDIANSATTSLSGFVAGLKSIAVNMAIFFAISTAIQLVVEGLDKLIVTQDEANEQFKNSSREYNYNL